MHSTEEREYDVTRKYYVESVYCFHRGLKFVHETKTLHIDFPGNINVIAIGDLYQLKPYKMDTYFKHHRVIMDQ